MILKPATREAKKWLRYVHRRKGRIVVGSYIRPKGLIERLKES